ncbi:MAG: hypothetical protein U5L09_19845 [Bacteroidales bacterium]|nr:hypothetical protein [Bacteroidales bacterium]
MKRKAPTPELRTFYLLEMHRQAADKILKRGVCPIPVTLLHHAMCQLFFQIRQVHKTDVHILVSDTGFELRMVHAGQFNIRAQRRASLK